MSVNKYTFFEDQIEDTEINTIFTRSGAIMVLEVLSEGSFLIEVLGNMSSTDNEGSALGAIDLKEYSISSTITKSGLYMIDMNGLAGIKIKFTNTGGTPVSLFGDLKD